MEEEINPPQVSRKNGTHLRKTERYKGGGEGSDRIECSGRSCQSCTAALIADCVALCCCPCAVVNCLIFALVKVPWTVGRRCLGLGKNNRRKKKKKQLETTIKCKKGCGGGSDRNDGESSVVDQVGISEKRWWNEEGISEISSWEEDTNTIGCVSPRFEAERVWLELYQVGHLGFGRVSFTGIQPQVKTN